MPSALGKLGANVGGLGADLERTLGLPPPHAGRGHPHLAQARRRPQGGAARGRGAQGPVRLHRAPAPRPPRRQDPGRRDPEAAGRHPRRPPQGPARDPRQPARRRSQRGRPLPGPGALRPRPHRARPQGQARPGHRPRRRGPPRDPGPLPPHQEQPGADRRAGRGQDRHRGGAGPAHRHRRRARVAEEQARRRPRPGRPDRGGQVPRRVRGPPEGRAQGGRRSRRARSSSSSTSCTPWWARARPRGRWTPPTCSSPPWPGASCAASAPPPSTSTRSTSRRTPPWSGASSRSTWASPTVEETIAILRGLKERYEVHHGVRIQDAALVAAATLSNRYIADRFLPDKAIDLVDEAAEPPAHRDRLPAHRDRRGGAQDRPARDRARRP